jgi:hypothetical protein
MKDTILTHKFERDEFLKADYVPRENIEKARENVSNNLVKVIVGPRRAGKSVFSIQILKGLDFAYLNLDDERILSIKDYDEIIKGLREVYGETKYILFDEIQNLEGWELFVNRLQRKGYNLIITGSNSRLLSKELATHLTGRYIQFQIFPFSFSEFLKAKGIALDETVKLKEKQGMILYYLNEYLTMGGFPEIVLKNVNLKDYLKFLVDSVLFKDVVRRYNLRYSRKLYDLAVYLINNHSMEFSSTKLKNILSFRSVHTVDNYISYLEEAFLNFTLKRFSFKMKEQIKAPRKVYAYDTGVINVFKFKISQDAGKLMENVVALELLRRGEEFYYFRNSRGQEIDFVLKRGIEIPQLIQVCYDIKDIPVRERECKSLQKVAPELNCKDLLVITWDYEGKESYGEYLIEFIPLWKWLIYSYK